MFYFHLGDKSTERVLFCLMNIGSSQRESIAISSKASEQKPMGILVTCFYVTKRE